VLVGLAAGLTGCAGNGVISGDKPPAPAAVPATGISIVTHPEKLTVLMDGRLFTEYRYTNGPMPILYPLIGPTGAGVTRNFPMEDQPGEEQDHPNHRSMWYAHGLVNGVDFWSDAPEAGRIVHDGFLAVRGGAEQGVIRARNKWIAADGRVVCSDERKFTFHRTGPAERVIDFEVTINADQGEEVVLGDTREGTMALRVAEPMRLMRLVGGPNPQSSVVNSEGARDLETWGKRAKWCDYAGPVSGGIVGVALFDHPKNPRHPTWWMVRDYGLFAANPFGQHEFEKLANEHVGDLKIPAGQSVTFRYRLLLHRGTAEQANVARHYEAYAAEEN
jgi:hypothetical protein